MNYSVAAASEQLSLRPVLVPDAAQLVHARFDRHHFSPHAHDHYVLAAIEEGVEAIHHRGVVHLAGVGGLVLIGPEEVHTGFGGTDGSWVYLGLYASSELVRDVGNAAGPLPRFAAPVVHDRALAHRLLQAVRSAWASDDMFPAEVLLVEALSALLRRHATMKQVRPASSPAAIELARQYLHDNQTRQVSLRELGRTVGVSPWHLSREFTRQIGATPAQYLRHLRVRRAAGLIADGEPIVTAAISAGFADQAHLTRIFRRQVGTTPGAYARAFVGQAR